MTNTQTEAINCAQCGTSIAPSAKFCGQCGIRVAASTTGLWGVLRGIAVIAILLAIGAFLLIDTRIQGLFQTDLGLDVSSESSEAMRRQHGTHTAQVTITNIKKQPIVIEEVVFNGSSEPGCTRRPKQTLNEGRTFSTMIGGFFGMCGNLVRVSIKTDRGDQDYYFNPR